MTAVERPVARPTNLLFVIAFIILFITGAFLAGAYFYRGYLDSAINRPCEAAPGSDTQFRRWGLAATVALEEKNIDRATILLLQRLENKFAIAADIAKKHVAILPVLQMLEELTLPTLSYSHFDFGDKGIMIDGVASTYEDIAVQSTVFGRDRNRIKSFIFSDLDLDSRGDVRFKLSLVPSPSLTLYAPHLVTP